MQDMVPELLSLPVEVIRVYFIQCILQVSTVAASHINDAMPRLLDSDKTQFAKRVPANDAICHRDEMPYTAQGAASGRTGTGFTLLLEFTVRLRMVLCALASVGSTCIDDTDRSCDAASPPPTDDEPPENSHVRTCAMPLSTGVAGGRPLRATAKGRHG